MIIACCQINSVIGDIEGNKKRILDYYRQGLMDGADIVVFPELSLVGYPPLDFVEKREFRQAVEDAAKEIASQTSETALLFGSLTVLEDNVGTNVFNSALLCYNGGIQFVQRKTLIPNYDVFDEMRYYESAPDVYLFPFRGEQLGISICEDIWNDKDYWKKRMYPNDPVEKLVRMGATVLLNLSASPYSYGKRSERKEMLSALTKVDKLPLAYVCCVGAQTDLIFDGASMCFDSRGNLIRLGKSYTEDYFLFDTRGNSEPIEAVEGTFEQEVLDALTMGVREYCTKQNFQNVVIGLSGGIDSALVTYIAVRALGTSRVKVVLLPSKYSSDGSVSDALKLVENLDITSDIVPIQPMFDEALRTLKPVFYKISPSLPNSPDVTEENLQARIRGMLLMAISNKLGYLVLSTSNKSEAAVGYATLYGDMCGGLAVIADVYKTDVYRIAEYINREKEIIPQNILTKAPSAELRPNQTDQDSLPPYPFLDTILRYYLEENKEAKEISELTADLSLIPGEPGIVQKILRMVDRSEYKRNQAAPALRISKKAFGFGRRFPLVQGWRK